MRTAKSGHGSVVVGLVGRQHCLDLRRFTPLGLAVVVGVLWLIGRVVRALGGWRFFKVGVEMR